MYAMRFYIVVKEAMSEAITNLLQMREREGKELEVIMLQYKEQLQEQVVHYSSDGTGSGIEIS